MGGGPVNIVAMDCADTTTDDNEDYGRTSLTDSDGKIAIMAHDAKRDELVELLIECGQGFRHRKLVATHVTGMVCSQRLNMDIELLQSSAHGGDLQICAMVVGGSVDAVMFLRDPLYGGHAREDVAALIRDCDMHHVPIATNVATARAVLGNLPFSPEVPASPAEEFLGPGRIADPNRN